MHDSFWRKRKEFPGPPLLSLLRCVLYIYRSPVSCTAQLLECMSWNTVKSLLLLLLLPLLPSSALVVCFLTGSQLTSPLRPRLPLPLPHTLRRSQAWKFPSCKHNDVTCVKPSLLIVSHSHSLFSRRTSLVFFEAPSLVYLRHRRRGTTDSVSATLTHAHTRKRREGKKGNRSFLPDRRRGGGSVACAAADTVLSSSSSSSSSPPSTWFASSSLCLEYRYTRRGRRNSKTFWDKAF